ncbi:MAG: zinc ribbon domain-containing protein [Methanobrevibacter sp.]|nr:zinc ribbon domain-containing protein [Methanobrevibacter sp.]
MKCCEICGTFNFKENNYCTHCGNYLIVKNVCPHCGEVNMDNQSFCVKCKKQIKPVVIDDFDVLFNEYNKELLLNAEIDNKSYHNILKNIFKRADFSNLYGNSIKDKILDLANVFTVCKSKSRGYERGFSLGSMIYYDDRLDDSVQIATIIHELAHYLLFNIIEEVMCNILNVKSSKTLQSFIWFFLMLPDISIMSEYCAHTVEGRFIPYGYQNYASFNQLVENTQIDDDSLNNMIVLGNSFANELIVFLEKYIDKELRELIKLQYKKDLKSPKYESIKLETDISLPLDVKNKLLVKKLCDAYEIGLNLETRKELEFIKEGLEEF